MKKNDASRKALRIIGSILVAIALWIYVDTVTSPEVTLKVKNVPVEFSGEDTTLADRGLMLLSGYDTTVDLVIKGPRNELRFLPDVTFGHGVVLLNRIPTISIGKKKMITPEIRLRKSRD